ncbi:MAG TPA: M56 family metallopeptidase, partial [Ginsengibacter sp.]|nr:M56 family metallopeptidase [Ginsengibacter sp.]
QQINVVQTEAKGTPFSFFRLIFWNPRLDYRSGDGREILHHELIHVRQLHSLDKLIINLIQIVFWFNPVFWLIKGEINIVHEFLADEESIGDADGAKFSRLALQTAYPGYSWPANNNFAYSPLKRRLAMILKNNKKKVSYFGRLMVLPLTALVFVFFSLKAQELPVPSIPDAYARAENGQMKNSLDWSQLKKQSTMDEKDPLVIVNGNIIDYSLLKNITDDQLASIEVLKGSLKLAAIYGNDLALNGVWKIELKKGYHVPDASSALLNNSKANTIPEDQKKVFIKTEVPAQFPGGAIGWSGYINKVIADHEQELKGEDVRGGCKLRFVVDEEGKVSNVEALTKTGTKAARIAIDAVQKGPKWVPAKQNGRVVKSYVERTFHFVRFTPPKVVKDKTVVTPPDKVGNVMSKVDKEAQFPGGVSAWKAYIAKALTNYSNEFRE